MLHLKEAELKGKVVLYHPDYSVPLKDGVIQDDYRIITTYPTLDYLIKEGAKIIVATKIGDPKGKVVPELNTRPVAERLADHYTKQTVRLAHAINAPEVTAAISEMKEGDLLVLPNLRFLPGEQAGDPAFAQELAALADLYVNDAFAVDHRSDASIVAVPELLPSYAGFLLEDELKQLGMLIKSPAHPFVVIMGGAKVSDKIEVINKLAAVADTLLIGGAMANTFLLAKGEDIGASKAEPDKVDLAKKLIADLGDKLVLAADYVKDESDGADKFRYLDIGEKAVAEFEGYLKEAKTIFWNGSLGYAEDERYAKATEEIAGYIGSLKGVTSVVAGGDTVETITKLKLHDQFSFVSTGGGAALELLAGAVLPGVEALEKAGMPTVKMVIEEKETQKPVEAAEGEVPVQMQMEPEMKPEEKEDEVKTDEVKTEEKREKEEVVADSTPPAEPKETLVIEEKTEPVVETAVEPAMKEEVGSEEPMVSEVVKEPIEAEEVTPEQKK